jgi:hypothetical protein
MPGQSFNWLDLYVDADRKEAILKNFENFATHLRSLKPYAMQVSSEPFRSDPILMKLLEPFRGEYCRALIMSGLRCGTR